MYLFLADLSHNKIGDSGARAVGKLLNGRCKLTLLDLCDNKIRTTGAAAIGHALGKNFTLKSINLRLNRLDLTLSIVGSLGYFSISECVFLLVSCRLGDDGGQAVCRALLKNNTLTHVYLGSNDLGEPTAAILAQVRI